MAAAGGDGAGVESVNGRATDSFDGSVEREHARLRDFRSRFRSEGSGTLAHDAPFSAGAAGVDRFGTVRRRVLTATGESMTYAGAMT